MSFILILYWLVVPTFSAEVEDWQALVRASPKEFQTGLLQIQQRRLRHMLCEREQRERRPPMACLQVLELAQVEELCARVRSRILLYAEDTNHWPRELSSSCRRLLKESLAEHQYRSRRKAQALGVNFD